MNTRTYCYIKNEFHYFLFQLYQTLPFDTSLEHCFPVHKFTKEVKFGSVLPQGFLHTTFFQAFQDKHFGLSNQQSGKQLAKSSFKKKKSLPAPISFICELVGQDLFI